MENHTVTLSCPVISVRKHFDLTVKHYVTAVIAGVFQI